MASSTLLVNSAKEYLICLFEVKWILFIAEKGKFIWGFFLIDETYSWYQNSRLTQGRVRVEQPAQNFSPSAFDSKNNGWVDFCTSSNGYFWLEKYFDATSVSERQKFPGNLAIIATFSTVKEKSYKLQSEKSEYEWRTSFWFLKFHDSTRQNGSYMESRVSTENSRVHPEKIWFLEK